MVNVAQLLHRLTKKRILVLGDLLLDVYLIGHAGRLSPEAPVPVVQIQREEKRPGGAGNVALNLHSLGAEVLLLSRVGQDEAGEDLKQILSCEGVVTDGVVVERHYQTPTKTRVLAAHQQVVRFDRESTAPIVQSVEEELCRLFALALPTVDLVAISDYAKGTLSPSLIAYVIEQCRLQRIPVVTDPKGDDFARYRGTTVLKPNLMETYRAARLSPSAPLEKAIDFLFLETGAQAIMVTRAEEGASLFLQSGGRFDCPAHVREVRDVTGAGDTVLAMLAYALGHGLEYREAVQLCNLAAGVVIQKLGCGRATVDEIYSFQLNLQISAAPKPRD